VKAADGRARSLVVNRVAGLGPGDPLGFDDPHQIGPYRLVSLLGQGGMARVYFGVSPINRAVAVKVILPDLASDPIFVEGFRREVQAARKVNGAYTASVVGAGPDDVPPWLATLYVRGPSLKEAVRKQPFPEIAIWRLAGGLVEALQDIHEHLVHRDLKPSNVLLDPDGPRVIDFGISAALDELRTTPGRQEPVGLGTPAYMSPEQARGERVGPPSDVFSLGSVIAFAATGVDLFGTSEPPATWYAVMNRVINHHPDLGNIPPSLREIVASCLRKEPEDRPSLRDLLEEITPRLAGDPDEALTSFWPKPLAGFIGNRYDLTDPGPVLARYRSDEAAALAPSGQAGSPSAPIQPAMAERPRPGGIRTTSSPAAADLAETDVKTVRLGAEHRSDGDQVLPGLRSEEPPRSGIVPSLARSRARLGVIAGAAALTLAVLVTGVVLWLMQQRMNPVGASSVSIDLPAQHYSDGLIVHTRWTLGGKGGSSLTEQTVATDATGVPLAVQFREPVPKTIVTRLGAATFIPSAPMIIDGPGLVWNIRIRAHGEFVVRYAVTVSALGVSTARLKGLVSELSPVQPGPVIQHPQRPRLQTLTIMPPILYIAPGRSKRLMLVGLLSNGKRAPAADLSKVVWTTADRSVAEINASGKVTAVAAGQTRIYAKVGTVRTFITVTVSTFSGPVRSPYSSYNCNSCSPPPSTTTGSTTHTPTQTPTTGTPSSLPS
jgi:serine/threonine protein kinase